MAVCRSPSQTITPTRYHPSSASVLGFNSRFSLHYIRQLFYLFISIIFP